MPETITCPACRDNLDKVGVDHKGHRYEGRDRLKLAAGRYRIDDFEVKDDRMDLYVTHLKSGRHFVIRVPTNIPVVESMLRTQETGGKVIGSEFEQLEGEELDEAKTEASEEWRR